MEALSSFDIPFARASEGKNEHHFELSGVFFSSFEDAIVKDGNFQVHVVLDKQSSYSFLQFEISGDVSSECDRCLRMRNWPIQANYTVLIKYDQDEVNEDREEDVLHIPRETQQINVKAYLYEYISISLPMAKYCDDIGLKCSEEMTKYLDRSGEPIHNPLADQLKEVKFN